MAARPTAERHERPLLVPASPVIWGLHFMLCYVTAAVWCGKFASGAAGLGPAGWAIAAYTAGALAAIVAVGAAGYRQHRLGNGDAPHDDDTPEDRHRFIGYSTLLLSWLSGVAVVYTALAAVLVETCR
jgi:hypothetical protein